LLRLLPFAVVVRQGHRRRRFLARLGELPLPREHTGGRQMVARFCRLERDRAFRQPEGVGIGAER
jgi:hypothetical protein